MPVFMLHDECDGCINKISYIEDLPEDVALITGYVKDEDEDEIKKIRKEYRSVIAYGTCTCYGGIFGLSNQRKNTIVPIRYLVNIDREVPGCPPQRIMLSNQLRTPIIALSVCSRCDRERTGEMPDTIGRLDSIQDDNNTCLINQGIVCSGGVSYSCCERCEQCIAFNTPCRGCIPRNPNSGEFLIDQVGSLANKVGIDTMGTEWTTDMLGPEEDDLTRAIPDPLGTFYRFTLASSRINRGIKDSFGDIYKDVMIGRPAEEATDIASRIYGSRSVSVTLNYIECIEEIVDIEVDATVKKLRGILRSSGSEFKGTIEKKDLKRVLSAEDAIRRIGGDENLSNVSIGGFRTPIEGIAGVDIEKFDEYKMAAFQDRCGESTHSDGTSKVSVSIDGSGIIDGWEYEIY